MLKLDMSSFGPYYSPLIDKEFEIIPGKNPCFFSFESADDLSSILQRPNRFFLEMGTHNSLSISLAAILIQKPDFALCMTTASAYRASLAHLIASNLNLRFGLQNQKSLHIQTCLQEAIINAIVHGNLSIDSDFSTLTGFDSYHSLIDLRLRQAPYQHRRVSIAAWDHETHLQIAVTDQGTGYKLPEGQKNDELPHGRGLTLIQALSDRCWVGDNRRTLFMHFNYR